MSSALFEDSTEGFTFPKSEIKSFGLIYTISPKRKIKIAFDFTQPYQFGLVLLSKYITPSVILFTHSIHSKMFEKISYYFKFTHKIFWISFKNFPHSINRQRAD